LKTETTLNQCFELFPKQEHENIQQAETEPSTDAITRKLSHVVFLMNANP